MPRQDPRFPTLAILDHPLLLDRLTQLRDRHTPPESFRRLLQEAAWFLAHEATRDLALADSPIETPLEAVAAPVLAEPSPLLVAILRAGLGMTEGLRRLLPRSPVGHIGLYRDHGTRRPVQYYTKLPPGDGRQVLLCDPMLATGGSVLAAIDLLNRHGFADAQIRLLALVAAPEGVAALAAAHPTVPVYAAALDQRLDANAYIRPGLGDAGDRLFGTE